MSLTLVTGGTRGIGAAIAMRLARDGHDLVLGYARDDDAAEEARLAVEDAGARCAVVRADLTDPEGVDQLFDAAAEHGRLTGVVNNAGATLHIGRLAETPPEIVAATVDLNLTSALLVARARGAHPRHVVRRTGRRDRQHQLGCGDAGLAGGVRPVRRGEGRRRRADRRPRPGGRGRGHPGRRRRPGIVRTTIHADAGEPGRLDRVGPLVPLGRAGEPHEVADAVGWLMSDEASYVTGTTLRVAGGR